MLWRIKSQGKECSKECDKRKSSVTKNRMTEAGGNNEE